MCTICGHFVQNGQINSNDIYDMLKKMEHRGPDTHGIYLDGEIENAEEIDNLKNSLPVESKIAMGHSRLKIVGAENITQPFTLCDGKLSLIHNIDVRIMSNEQIKERVQ